MEYEQTAQGGRVLRRVWAAALGLFILAGLTGVFFRLAVAFVWTPGEMGGLVLGNVRHAHSHLMYFGWATPALLALLFQVVKRQTGRAVTGAGGALALVLVLATVAYLPFLLWGYAPAVIGTARLPLSVMAAGFNVIGWYGCAGLYGRAQRGGPRSGATWVFDLALFFLLLSTLGAWGLPLSQAVGWGGEALQAALTHVFLDTFSEGWFVLGVVGLAYASAERAGRSVPRWPAGLAAAGVPFTFALALPARLVPPLWKTLAVWGGVAVALGLLATVVVLWKRLPGGAAGRLWRIALALLAFKAAGQLVVACTPGTNWAALHGLRILYLHLMLLGFVTLGLFAAAREAWDARGGAAMALAVGVLLASLVPLTGYWPAWLAGPWVRYVAAVAALAPVAAAAYALVASLRHAPPVAITAEASDA